MTASRNYWVDLVMLVLSVILVTSSFLLWIVLPQGYFRSRLIWLEVHKWTGLAVTATVVIHLVLHRRWLWNATLRRLRREPARAPSSATRSSEEVS